MAVTDKREEIIRASLELIAEHGFHGSPMSMIADRAGVAAGTIYRYFENKDALIIALFGEIDEKIGAGYFGLPDAQRLASKVLRENAMAFFKL